MFGRLESGSFGRRSLARGAAVLVAILLSGCTWEPQWRKFELGDMPFEDGWIGITEIARYDGYLEDPAFSDRGRKIYASKWRSHAMPFGHGTRKRVRAEFVHPRDQPGWELRYCVERQDVPDIAKSANPEEVDWKPDGQDADTEDRIAAKLAMRFGGDPFAPRKRP